MLICGDALEQLNLLESESIDLILADLPYGSTTCKWDNIIPFELLWIEFHRIVKPHAAICLFGTEPFSSQLRISNINHFKYDWIWNKKIPSGMGFAKYQPMRQHEIISVFSKKTTYYYPQKTLRSTPIKSGGQKKLSIFSVKNGGGLQGNKEFKKKYFTKNPTSILSFDKVRKGSLHPTQKPVELLKYLILTYTKEQDYVLDPTMGSGSTGVACKELNRNFIGIEKEQEYFEIAEKRILNV